MKSLHIGFYPLVHSIIKMGFNLAQMLQNIVWSEPVMFSIDLHRKKHTPLDAK